MTLLNPLPMLLLYMVTSSHGILPCKLRVHLARAEQTDEFGRKCWDMVKVPSCGGRCDSSEIADWEFPFKKSHHPVCVFGGRRPLVVRLRHCDPGVSTGTDVFHYIAAEDCRCKTLEVPAGDHLHENTVAIRTMLTLERFFSLNPTQEPRETTVSVKDLRQAESEDAVAPLQLLKEGPYLLDSGVPKIGLRQLLFTIPRQVCSSEYTSCEWLPPNSTLLDEIYDFEDLNEE